MHFYSKRHAERYQKALVEYEVCRDDFERKALMYCLTAVDATIDKMDLVYNKETSCIVLSKVGDGDGNEMNDYVVHPMFYRNGTIGYWHWLQSL